VTPGRRIAAVIIAGEQEALLCGQAGVLAALGRLDPAQLTIAASGEAPPQSLTLVAGPASVYLPLSGLVDLNAERAKLDRELAETESQIQRARELLAGPFAQRAPANVVQREKDKLGDLQVRAERLRSRLADLS
jgi:valyl-tRNA synthetase